MARRCLLLVPCVLAAAEEAAAAEADAEHDEDRQDVHLREKELRGGGWGGVTSR